MVPIGCSFGWILIYFGCWQKSNISWLYSILWFQLLPQFNSFGLFISITITLACRRIKGPCGQEKLINTFTYKVKQSFFFNN